MKKYTIIAYLGAIIFILLGNVIVGSVLYNVNTYLINLVVGCIFIGVGIYLFLKARNFLRVNSAISIRILEEQVTRRIYRRFLQFELIFVLLTLLSGGILLTLSVFRVFIEKVSVFN